MKFFNYILGIGGVYSANEWNEIEYVWMNEADTVFSNEDSLVEVPSFKPSLLECLHVKSMMLRSNGIWMNYIKEVMCYMQNVVHAIWYVLCVNVMCYVQMWKVWWCKLFHGITFLCQMWKAHGLS